MFNKENYKREVFEKYQEKLNKKKILRDRTKNFLVAAVGILTICLTTSLVYTGTRIYEKNIDQSNQVTPGKKYDGDETKNIVENKTTNNNNKPENTVVEEPEPVYEPTGEFFKYLKLVEVDPKYYNSPNPLTEANKLYYDTIYNWDYEAQILGSYYRVEEKENNLTITFIDSEKMKSLEVGEYIRRNENLDFNESYIINNVNTQDVESIFYAAYGQDLSDPLIIYIIQKDGTVKGIDVLDCCKNGYFIADNVVGLENIDRIENVDAGQLDDSGFITVLAFTKDNKIYNLNDYDYIMSKVRESF